jgi:hypothetical protein
MKQPLSSDDRNPAGESDQRDETTKRMFTQWSNRRARPDSRPDPMTDHLLAGIPETKLAPNKHVNKDDNKNQSNAVLFDHR